MHLDPRYDALVDRMEAVEKKRRISITLAETYQEQGARYLEQAQLLHLDDTLVPFNPQHATALAQAVATDMQAAQLSAGEGPVQELMVALANKVLALVHLPSRGYADTSRTGLPILPAGRRAKPDLAGYEWHACASAVSTINEAKPTLTSAKHDCEAAYQVVQRSLQLQGQQPKRSKWVFASLGRDTVRVFLIETADKVLHTGSMPGRPSVASYWETHRVLSNINLIIYGYAWACL